MTIVLLQTGLLAMTGIGVADAPLDPADPHDLEGPGIHLRWSFPTVGPYGTPLAVSWPTTGFTLYRRPAAGLQDDVVIDFPGGAIGALPGGVLRLPGDGAQLELDPTVLQETLAADPSIADLTTLLDAYPRYVTVRFDHPVRAAALDVSTIAGSPRPRRIVVRAHDGDDAVDEAVRLGGVVPLLVRADRITHLRILLDGIRIQRIVATSTEATTDLAGWTQIVQLPPETSWPVAMMRIPAAQRPEYEAGFVDLALELGRLLDTTDPTPRWQRTSSAVGSRDDGGDGSDVAAPTWEADLQAQLLLFAVDPFLARLLGLLHADTSVEAASGDPFDYLVTAPLGAAGLGAVGWISYALSSTGGRPLAPPHGLEAAPLPERVFLPDPATGMLTREARIGLAWDLAPAGIGGPLGLRAARYDVEALPAGATTWSLLTADGAVVATGQPDGFGGLVFPDPLIADRRGEGTHAYRVRAIDVFGRRSTPSATAEATVADVVGPPPPVDVRATLVDPLDPYLAPDVAALGPGLLVRFAYPRAQALAGDDCTAFRVAVHVGSLDAALDWRDAATWGAPLVEAPRRLPADGQATDVRVLAPPAAGQRSVRVTSDLPSAGEPPGTLVVGDVEYPVGRVRGHRDATFTLAWPDALGLPDPVPGPCTWHAGYEVFVAGYAPPLDPARGTVVGSVAVGAVDGDGNAGRMSRTAPFQAVDRAVPAPPGAFAGDADEELVASRPDAYGRSRIALAWAAEPGARAHVLRALDSGILVAHGRDPADAAGLTAGELRALADAAAAEPAFGLLTPAPVSGAGYVDETLAGHAANRYVYRVRPISASGVTGDLGPASPPVRVPDVVAPAAPRIVRATGGEGAVELVLARSGEPDVDHYAVYRTGAPEDADDVRRMALVGTVAQGTGPVVVFSDATAPPRVDHVYRVTCIDSAGNASAASRPVRARCWSTAPPTPPTLRAQRSRDGTTVTLRWGAPAADVTAIVLRGAGDGPLHAVSGWLDAATHRFDDAGRDPAVAQTYVLRVRGANSVVADSAPLEVPPA